MNKHDLRTLLAQRQISQGQLADLAGVNIRTVSRWCNAGGALPQRTVLQIEAALAKHSELELMSDDEEGEYPLQRDYSIPEKILERRYHGCGNGVIWVDKATGEMVDMRYLDDRGQFMDEQNLEMSPKAGQVIGESDKHIMVRANFSCCTACLY